MEAIISLVPYALGIALVIIIPAILIAKQEIAIEGPFGWSALTFTKRYSTKSWVSKIYQSYSGKDKWATEYHLASNAIWLFIYFVSFVYIAYYTRLIGTFDVRAFTSVVVLAVVSDMGLSITEDYIWFLLHPYYGPDRLTSEYIPWHENLKGGIPVGNWKGAFLTIIMTGVLSLIVKDISTFLVWLIALAFIIVFCFGVKQWSKSIKRKKLAKFWWKKIKYVLIKRAPYPSEGVNLKVQKDVEAYVIPCGDAAFLILGENAKLLEDALAGKI
jgi:hypothetical protein